MYWCYFDESWKENHDTSEFVGVLGGCIGPFSAFQKLEREMFKIRRKYYGRDHAKDASKELKGNSLLNRRSFKYKTVLGYSQNLCVAREVLEWVTQSRIQFIGVSVYGDTKPELLSPEPKQLAEPFKRLCKIAEAALPSKRKAHLVFDQRLGAQQGIAIGIKNYLAGRSRNGMGSALHSEPLFGVSHVMAGLQLADIVSYTIASHNSGNNDISPFYRLISGNQVARHGKNIGLIRLQKNALAGYGNRKKR